MPRVGDDIPSMSADTSGFEEGISEAQRQAERLADLEISPRYEMVRVMLRWMALWAGVASFFIGRIVWLLTPMGWPLWGRLLPSALVGGYVFFYMVRLGRRFDRVLIQLSEQEQTRKRSDALMRRVTKVEETLNLAIEEAEKRSVEERIEEAERQANQEQLDHLLRIRAGLREAQAE